MPTYTYYCNKCKKKFETFCSIKDYKEQSQCPKCNSAEKTHRLYVDDLLSLNTSVKKSDSELSTIGDIANRNRDRMSDDQKSHLTKKHNDYKEETSNKPLPKGMSRMKKPKFKTKWT